MERPVTGRVKHKKDEGKYLGIIKWTYNDDNVHRYNGDGFYKGENKGNVLDEKAPRKGYNRGRDNGTT